MKITFNRDGTTTVTAPTVTLTALLDLGYRFTLGRMESEYGLDSDHYRELDRAHREFLSVVNRHYDRLAKLDAQDGIHP